MLGEHLLGRFEPPDRVHEEKYPMRRLAAAPANVEVTIKPPTLSDYNQRDTPKCVAYSSSRVVNWFNRFAFDADWLYAECKKIDPWPGADGTSARYACDVLRTQGHWRTISGVKVKMGPKLAHGIERNTWALSVDDIRTVFAYQSQPVLMGSDWFQAWFDPEMRSGEYWLQPLSKAGGRAGGHEWGIWACSDARQAFGLRNTWGRSFPPLTWIAYPDIERLFGEGADCCILRDLATR